MPKINAATVEQHRAQTHTIILDATLELIAERGVQWVSMGDVAKRAGVNRTVLYNYADDRISLLATAVQRQTAGLAPALAAIAADSTLPAKERLRSIIELLLGGFAAGTQNLIVLSTMRQLTHEQQIRAVASFRENVLVHVTRLIHEGMRVGEFRPVTDLDTVVALMVGVMDAAITLILQAPEHASDTARTTAEFLLRGLESRQGR